MGPDGARLQRVITVGATGAGKSTLGRQLASRRGVEFIELDALYWGPRWTPAEPSDFRARVAAATAGPAWVVAGNYGAVRDVLWPRADTIVWLDYSLPLMLGRLTARTLRRAITREMLWSGNRERLWEHAMLWSERSIFNWVLATYWRYRRDFPRFFTEPPPPPHRRPPALAPGRGGMARRSDLTTWAPRRKMRGRRNRAHALRDLPRGTAPRRQRDRHAAGDDRPGRDR